jgi:hypothetical protein
LARDVPLRAPPERDEEEEDDDDRRDAPPPDLLREDEPPTPCCPTPCCPTPCCPTTCRPDPPSDDAAVDRVRRRATPAFAFPPDFVPSAALPVRALAPPCAREPVAVLSSEDLERVAMGLSWWRCARALCKN